MDLVGRALRPGGSYGLVCFRPEGGSGYTDQQVYERASLGGGLGYSGGQLRALWDTAPFSLRVLRQMKKTDGQEARFGADFLWVLLATKADTTRALPAILSRWRTWKLSRKQRQRRHQEHLAGAAS